MRLAAHARDGYSLRFLSADTLSDADASQEFWAAQAAVAAAFDGGAPGARFHVGSGSLARWLPPLDAVPRRGRGRHYLALDPARVARWREVVRKLPASVQVDPLPSSGGARGPPERVLTVGLAWRSLVNNVDRAPSYATAEQLGGLLLPLKVPPAGAGAGAADAAFRIVRLQYDECAAELQEIYDKFGVRVHDVGCDLLDDLDDAAHLMAALDVVVTPMVSTADLAGATGAVPVLVFAPTQAHFRLLGRHAAAAPGEAVQMPCFGGGIEEGVGGVHVFGQRPPRSGVWATCFADIAAALHAMFARKFA